MEKEAEDRALFLGFAMVLSYFAQLDYKPSSMVYLQHCHGKRHC